jgi:hypothetical protein
MCVCLCTYSKIQSAFTALKGDSKYQDLFRLVDIRIRAVFMCMCYSLLICVFCSATCTYPAYTHANYVYMNVHIYTWQECVCIQACIHILHQFIFECRHILRTLRIVSASQIFPLILVQLSREFHRYHIRTPCVPNEVKTKARGKPNLSIKKSIFCWIVLWIGV